MKIKKMFKVSIGLMLCIAMVAALFVAGPVSAAESDDGFDGKLIAEYELITSEGQLGEDASTIVWHTWSSSSKGVTKDGRKATMNKASFVNVQDVSNGGTKIKIEPAQNLTLTGDEYLEFWIYSEKYAPTQVILDMSGWKNVPINVKANEWNFVRVPAMAGNLTNIYLDYTSVKDESDTEAFEIYFSDFSIRKYEIEDEYELITADGGIGTAAIKTSWGNGGWVAGGQTIADRKAYRTHASFAGHSNVSGEGDAPAADKLKVVFKESISIIGDEYAEFWVYSEKYAPTQVILDYGAWTNVSVDIEADKWNFVRVPLNEGTLNNIFLNYSEVKNANETNKADTSLFMIYLSDFTIKKFDTDKDNITAKHELITAEGGLGAASAVKWGSGAWVAGGVTKEERKSYRSHAAFAGHSNVSGEGDAPAADKLNVVFKESISIIGDEYAEFWVYSEKYAPTKLTLNYGVWKSVAVDIKPDQWNFVRVALPKGALQSIYLDYTDVKNANETNQADTELFMIYLSDFSIIRRENIVDIIGSETGEDNLNVNAGETLTFATDLLSGVYEATVIVGEYNASGVIENVKILTSNDMTYTVGNTAATVRVFLWDSISGIAPLAIDKELTVQVQQN